MTKEFNNLEEIKKYYDKETNTYVFKENGEYIDLVVFNFDLDVKANIDAMDIKARNINVLDIDSTDIKAYGIVANNIYACNITTNDITACNIDADNICARNIEAVNIEAHDIDANNIDTYDIKAKDISYYTDCVIHNNIECDSINDKRKNSTYVVVNGDLEELEND